VPGENSHNQPNKNEGDTQVVEPVAGSSAFDAEEYLPYLAECDLTEVQAREHLATLWEIMKAFVDLGFGVDSIHQIFPELIGKTSKTESGEIESKQGATVREFEEAAKDTKDDQT